MTDTKKAVKAAPKQKALAPFKPYKAFNSNLLVRLMVTRRMDEKLLIKDAAKIAKLPYSSFQQIESTGTCKPDALAKICNWLQVPIDTFF